MSTREDLVVPEEVADFLRRKSSFLVVGHKEPDGDCIGSQLAIGSALQRCGKTVQLLNPGPFDRQEIAEQERLFSQRATFGGRSDPDAVLVLDCSSVDRVGEIAEDLEGLPIAVVDHHASGESFGDVHYIRSTVPATTMLVLPLIRSLGLDPTPEEAQELFFGLATDTGFFRFLAPDQYCAFTTAADLVRAGASPREADRVVSSGRSIESRLLIARLLQRTEQLQNGAVLLTYQTAADDKEFGRKRDSDALYRLLLTVEGVRVVAVAKEKPEGTAVSFRATDETDVARLASLFGGGGHQKAAGAFIHDNLNTFLPRLRAELLRL